MEWLTAALAAFVVIVPVELPDKTFVATLVLATRYPPLAGVDGRGGGLRHPVRGRRRGRPGARAAAGASGPDRARRCSSPSGRSSSSAVRASADEEEAESRADVRAGGSRTRGPGWRAFGASFLVLFAAEWGDLSQLLTAGLVASGRPPVPVFVGSWAALASSSGAAVVLLGRVLLRKVRLSVVRYVGAAVCAILAVITVVAASSKAVRRGRGRPIPGLD